MGGFCSPQLRSSEMLDLIPGERFQKKGPGPADRKTELQLLARIMVSLRRPYFKGSRESRVRA